AVTFAEYTSTQVIPSGTLFIGTYLIDAMAINDVYYRYAKDSMGLYNQQIMYYKSELDSGHWKDIISAVGLSDILPTSTSVQDADLMQYKITCVIDERGIARNPDDGTETDIFTMTNPYDMQAIPELLPLKTIFDSGAVSQDTSDVSNRYTADVLYRFFNYDGTGENYSVVIIRNKAYRDYLYDHPNKTASIIGTNIIPMNVTVDITEDEVKYVTELAEKTLHLSCNMPQSEDRYPEQPAAFFDQILAWAEYYSNNRFANRRDSNGISRPYILPFENFKQSEWELFDRREDWKNPQSYMFMINGPISTPDQREFVNRWLSDSTIDYHETYTVPAHFLNNRWDSFIPAQTYAYPPYALTPENITDARLNDVFYAVTGKNSTNGDFSATLSFGSGWGQFTYLMYRYMDWMRNMYDIRDDVTYEMDEILEELNDLYRTERDAGNTYEADTLMRLMSRVDATRRAEIYYNMVYNEDNNYVVGPTLIYLTGLLQNGQGHLGQNFEFISGAEETNYSANNATLSVAEDALVQCQQKYFYYKGLSFGEGETVIKQKEYELSLKVMNSDNEEERRSALHDLAILYNVEESAIVDKSEERRIIDEMIPTAEDNYSTAIHETAGEDYLIAAADPSTSKATLREYLELQKEQANTEVVELQLLIKAYALRQNKSQGTLFINRRLDWANAQIAGIQTEDPFGKYARDSLNAHIKWLKDILKEVKNGTLNGNEPEEEADPKMTYQAQLLTALDNNDLAGAREADELIAKADAEASGGSTDGGLDDGTGGTDGDLTGDTGGTGELINEFREKIMEDPGDNENVPKYVDALGVLGDPNIRDMGDYMERYG
ncbi:MAG: hypothetical protein J6N76_07835, partial [Lachnospiraceae bacterium]|nr:hypothetical protein [Lachnospiraceae bacterium]